MTTNQLSKEASTAQPAKHFATRLNSPIPKVIALAAVIVYFQGCGDRDQPPVITKQVVQLDEIPPEVRDAARKAIPGVKFNEAWKNLDRKGMLHSYEIRGKNTADGKIREVRVSLSGEILESE
jgi:hypothetical protein